MEIIGSGAAAQTEVCGSEMPTTIMLDRNEPSANHTSAQPTGTRCRGFTLLEMVVALAIMAVLMGGMTSAVVIATRAVDDELSPQAKVSQAGDVLNRITADLAYATSFTERTATAVTFTVPDRDGDDEPESIRYAWSGTGGDPLTFEYNGADPVTIAEDVFDFDLTYLLTTVAPASLEGVESEEMLLIYHDNGPQPTQVGFTVGDTSWCAQYFLPKFPPNTIAWRITRIKFVAKRSGSSGGTNFVQIRPATAGRQPASTVLEQKTLSEQVIPGTYFWFEGSFDMLADLDPNNGMCLVITGINGPSAVVLYESGGSPMTPNTHFVTTNDGGATWSSPGDRDDLLFYVYGTVTTLEE